MSTLPACLRRVGQQPVLDGREMHALPAHGHAPARRIHHESRSRRITSSPSMSGKPRSRMTRSGWRVSAACTPSCPDSASTRRQPCPIRVARRNQRISGASSIRTTTEPGVEAGPGNACGSAIGKPLSPGRILERQGEPERGATARPTEPDPARPRGMSPIELLERPLLVAGRKARTLVAHRHDHLEACHPAGED